MVVVEWGSGSPAPRRAGPSVEAGGAEAGRQRRDFVDLLAAGLEAADGDPAAAIGLAVLRLRQLRPDDACVRDDLARWDLTRALTAASVGIAVARAVRRVAAPLLASSAQCRARSTALRGRASESAARRRAAAARLDAQPARSGPVATRLEASP